MPEPQPFLLLVDDDDVYRERLARAIRARGFDVRTASNAEAALALIELERPGYAVLDLRMPGESGLELLRRLKTLDLAMRVVMLTGYGSIATVMEAVHLGAVNYLTKPADVDEILAALLPEPPTEQTAKVTEVPSLARVAWEHIHRVMQDCEGNISEAARQLGLHRRSLQRKMGRRKPMR